MSEPTFGATVYNYTSYYSSNTQCPTNMEGEPKERSFQGGTIWVGCYDSPIGSPDKPYTDYKKSTTRDYAGQTKVNANSGGEYRSGDRVDDNALSAHSDINGRQGTFFHNVVFY